MKNKLTTAIIIVTILSLMVTSFVFEKQWNIFWSVLYIILLLGWLGYGIIKITTWAAKSTVKFFRK